jgi:NADH-quinone oxidoreductase subunit L
MIDHCGQLAGLLQGTLAVAAEPPAAAKAAGAAVGNFLGAGWSWPVVLMPGLPLLATLLVLACAIFKVKSKLPAVITVLCLGGAFAGAVLTYAKTAAGFSGGPANAPFVVKVFEWINIATPAGGAAVGGFAADVGFYIDTLTCLWMLFVTGLATLIALYASEYMSHDVGPGYCRFFGAFNLFVFSMSCLVMADNLVLLYLGWEGVGLCSYLLIGYFYKKPAAVAAAKKAFIVNRVGDLGLALGIMLAFVQFGTVSYAGLFEAVRPFIELAQQGRWTEIPGSVQWIALLLMVGAFGKSAQLPLYVWLPDAMEGPTPVSALIHAATMVTAGVYLVARTFPFFAVSEHALPIVAWVGCLTALFSATIGMAQFDIKRIMAYSTVSQLGYMFAGLGVLSPAMATADAAAAGPFHVFTHAFFKALLFLSCGAVMHGFAGQLDLRKLSGVMWMPGWRIVGLGMLVGCLNLAGFPFTAGFFSKDMILAEAFVNPHTGVIGWLLLLTAGLTAYYTFRIFFRVFVGPQHFEPGDEHHGADDHAHGDHGHGKPANEPDHGPGHAGDHGHGHNHGHFHPHAPGWAINLVLALLAIGSIAAAGAYFLHWVPKLMETSSTALALGGGHGGAHAGSHAHGTFLGLDPHGKLGGIGVMYLVSGAVGAVGIIIAFVLHKQGRTTAARAKADELLPLLGPIPGWAQNKWYVDEFYHALIRVPLWVASHIFHLIDKLVIDGLVNTFGWAPRGLGWAIRPGQSGILNGYALGMATGIGLFALVVVLMMR